MPQTSAPVPGVSRSPASGRAPEAAYRALEEIYRDLDREIAALGPRCDGRGICCDFDRVDHVLFATRLEVDYLKDHTPRERWSRPAGNRCPLQESLGRCGARPARMLGCRTYFCAPGWEPRGAELYERFLARVRDVVRAHDLEWEYAPVLPRLRE